MCCQTQSIIILLAEKHSVFSLTQFTHCHFTSMTSQAGGASSPLFDALLPCPRMARAAPGCSRLSHLRGSATGNSFMGLRAGKPSLVRVDGSGFLHAGSGPVPLPIRSLARAGAGLGRWSRPWAALGMLPAAQPRRQSQSCPSSSGCCCYFSVSGFFQHRHRFSWCCHNNWR